VTVYSASPFSEIANFQMMELVIGHVTHGRDGNIYKILVANPEKRRLLKDIGVNGRIILKWIIKTYVAKM
jgi:hypothetical protein